MILPLTLHKLRSYAKEEDFMHAKDNAFFVVTKINYACRILFICIKKKDKNYTQKGIKNFFVTKKKRKYALYI